MEHVLIGVSGSAHGMTPEESKIYNLNLASKRANNTLTYIGGGRGANKGSDQVRRAEVILTSVKFANMYLSD